LYANYVVASDRRHDASTGEAITVRLDDAPRDSWRWPTPSRAER